MCGLGSPDPCSVLDLQLENAISHARLVGRVDGFGAEAACTVGRVRRQLHHQGGLGWEVTKCTNYEVKYRLHL